MAIVFANLSSPNDWRLVILSGTVNKLRPREPLAEECIRAFGDESCGRELQLATVTEWFLPEILSAEFEVAEIHPLAPFAISMSTSRKAGGVMDASRLVSRGNGESPWFAQYDTCAAGAGDGDQSIGGALR
jgi:hypothetical protein